MAKWRGQWVSPDGHDEIPSWEASEPLRRRLEECAWRYAALIGAVDGGDMREADRQRFPDMAAPLGGRREWVLEDAVAFMATTAGTTREVARAWLEHEGDGDPSGGTAGD